MLKYIGFIHTQLITYKSFDINLFTDRVHYNYNFDTESLESSLCSTSCIMLLNAFLLCTYFHPDNIPWLCIAELSHLLPDKLILINVYNVLCCSLTKYFVISEVKGRQNYDWSIKWTILIPWAVKGWIGKRLDFPFIFGQ